MLLIIMSIENEEDRSFVEQLYIKHERHMYVIAYEVLHHHQDAEDCVHDTVTIIVKCLDKFKDAAKKDKTGKLLEIVCRNCAINKYKKNKEKSEFEYDTIKYDEREDDFVIKDIEDPEGWLEESIINEERINAIRDVINGLDDKYRDVLILRSLGLGHDDIANALGISCSLARQRLRRAKVKVVQRSGGVAHV